MNEEAKDGFVKLKMPKYYLAKHSDEDLQAAVLAEREACAKLCEEQLENTMLLTSYPPKSAAAFQILQLIKARGDKHD